MADEKLTPERAVRLLRAKGAELETQVAADFDAARATDDGALEVTRSTFLAADIALIAQLLADHIERTELSILEVDPHARDHIIELRPGKWVIQHPLSERLDGSLLDCSVEWSERDLGVYGRFVLVWDEEADEWVLGDKIQ